MPPAVFPEVVFVGWLGDSVYSVCLAWWAAPMVIGGARCC